MGKLKVILSTTAGGGSVAGVQSVTGEGVGGTPENVVMSFPNQSEIQTIRPLKTVNNESLEGTGNIDIVAGGAVNSVTGDGVGGTTEDVVLSFPNADEVDDSSTTNKFLTQNEKDKISQNETFISLLQTNKADQSDLDALDVRVVDNYDAISNNTQAITDLGSIKANQTDLDDLTDLIVVNSDQITNLDTRVTQNENDILDKISISTVASATEKGGLFFEWDSANDIMTIDNQPL